MKKLLLPILLVVGLTACSSTSPQPPPSGLDNVVFKITTNVTEVTNIVIQTNVTVQPGGVTITNFIPVPVIVEHTNYGFKPSDQSTAAASVIGTTLTAFGVPGGSLIGSAILGALAIWGSLKSRQATTSATIAGNSTQIIQVARNLILASPNGPAIAAKFDAWLIAHQQDANIANEVAAVVDQFVNPKDKEFVNVAETIVKESTKPL